MSKLRMVEILRGIPGSGKSAYARLTAPEAKILSADDYWGPRYEFSPALLGKAHTDCHSRYLDALEDGIPIIVIDNTNISQWEIAPYVALANVFGYSHMITTINANPDEAAARQLHNVPIEKILRMHIRLLQTNAPAHWNMRTRDQRFMSDLISGKAA